MRASVLDARGGGEDGENGSAAATAAQERAVKMRSIMMRRKLIDLARAQTDEIEFLRGELGALRERTFPSFAAGGGGGADEY
jgi:hypothetical protein